jgi:pimeloyl-ACP methyl ester carboxylesterase
MQARSHSWKANGLDHHVLEWSSESTAVDTVFLVHGFQDAAITFADVARPMAEAGLRVVAPDMRGFGDGARVPPAGYYYFSDYVADVVGLIRGPLGGRRVFLVGHSMGATVVTYVAGAFPELVAKLALLDGVGPPDNPPEVAPIRMRRWIEDVEKVRAQGDAMQALASREVGVNRLRTNHATLDTAILEARFEELATRDANGALRWKFDPLHRTMSPTSFYAAAYKAFARAVPCPVLHVSGGPRGHHVPDEDERLACFANVTRVTIDAGHMLHWVKPKELAEALVAFWRGGEGAQGSPSGSAG